MTMTPQITSISIVYSIVYSGADQRKLQNSASLAFVRGIHRWPVNSPHIGPVTQKMFPFDDVVIFKSHRTDCRDICTDGRSDGKTDGLYFFCSRSALWLDYKARTWPRLNTKTVFPSIGISIIKIRLVRPSYLYIANPYTCIRWKIVYVFIQICNKLIPGNNFRRQIFVMVLWNGIIVKRNFHENLYYDEKISCEMGIYQFLSHLYIWRDRTVWSNHFVVIWSRRDSGQLWWVQSVSNSLTMPLQCRTLCCVMLTALCRESTQSSISNDCWIGENVKLFFLSCTDILLRAILYGKYCYWVCDVLHAYIRKQFTPKIMKTIRVLCV